MIEHHSSSSSPNNSRFVIHLSYLSLRKQQYDEATDYLGHAIMLDGSDQHQVDLFLDSDPPI